MNPRANLLIVDDEPNIRRMLQGVLGDEGYRCVVASDLAAARALLESEPIDLVLLDVQLPGEDGLHLLEDAQLPPVIMMSGHGNIAIALQAIRRGALDFLEKPLAVERLLVAIANGLERTRLSEENRRLREAGTGEELLGDSLPMQALRATISRVAPSDARVLITGENGTGKELVARGLHRGSARARQAFIKVNCAAIPSELLESELFGHEKGAFTGALRMRRGKFELAQAGTLLLDEIGDMNPTTQAKLLRVLEENELERVGGERSIRLDVRVLAATNQDLEAKIAAGSFRKDLYFRLRVIPIHVPPLRERQSDVEGLAKHFLSHFARENGCAVPRLDAGAWQRLHAHTWPGNVRELRNLMERLVILASGAAVGSAQMAALLAGAVASDSDPHEGLALAERLAAYERQVLSKALERAAGNAAEAARALGLDRANLHRKLKRLGLSADSQ
jgi:two-component system nitrogen regulation response regulator NtrX